MSDVMMLAMVLRIKIHTKVLLRPVNMHEHFII